MKLEFSEPGLGCRLLVDAEEAVRERDLVELAHHEHRVIAEDGASNFDTVDRLLDEHLRVVPLGLVEGGRQFVRALHLAHAERRTRPRRFHEHGIGEALGVDGLVGGDGAELWSRDAGAARDRVRERFVHAQRRTLDVAAHVRDAGEFEQALDRAILAVLAVQQRQHDVEPNRLGTLIGEYKQSVHRAVRREGDGASTRLPVRARAFAEEPRPGLGDADVERLVLLEVEVARHLRGGLHRDVVLLRSAPEQDADAQPIHG